MLRSSPPVPTAAVILPIVVLALMFAATVSGVAAPGPVTGRLERALGEPEGRARDDAGRVAVWVHFADRGLAAAELGDALARAENALVPATRARRARALAPGQGLVDESDLPVNPAYVDGVAGTGAIARRTSRLLNAASFVATPDQVAAIGRLPYVREVDLVGRFTRSQAEVAPEAITQTAQLRSRAQTEKSSYGLNYGASLAGLEQINVPAAHDKGLSGAGVTIALFDTGFELTHECFANLDVAAAWDFVGDDDNVGQEPGDPENSYYHGTQVLGILAGYSEGNLIGPAYGSSVLLARTEDIGGETVVEEDNWIAALEWAESLGADVICSTVGYFLWYEFSDLDGSTSPMTIVADMASLRGVCVVVGVGSQRYNAAWPHILTPADGFHVISVGSVDLAGFVTSFSSPGPSADGRIKPDVMAQGIGTVIPLPFFDDVYGFMEGNDSTVPLVAGAVALLRQEAPDLTPIQIREALRETASRSLLPDNDFGWGVANLQAATAYWTPRIEHTPLTDQDSGGPAVVTATVTGRLPLDEVGPRAVWRVDGGSWQLSSLSPTGDDVYAGSIPNPVAGTTVEYYLQAANGIGQATFLPATAPQVVFSYEVGDDTTPPFIDTLPLTEQSVTGWPPTIRARVSDNVAVGLVELEYGIGSGPIMEPAAMTATAAGYEVEFPIPAGFIPAGTTVRYRIVARDAATEPNVSATPFMEFNVVPSLGRVLLVSDRFADGEKATDARGAVQVEADGVYTYDRTNAEDMVAWLTAAGFEVDVINGEDVVNASFLTYDVIFYTAGNSLVPLRFQTVTDNLLAWVADGGRLLIEGGDIAYYVLAGGDEEFAASILHISGYGNDDGNKLSVPVPHSAHPFLHRPYELPARLSLGLLPQGLNDFGASDVVFPTDDGTVVLQSTYGTNTGGVVIHDGNTGPDGGQTVYFPFDLGWMAAEQAQPLLVNAMTYLTLREPAGPSTVSGRVILAGRQDHAGTVVRAGRDRQAVTTADGSFTIEGLWGGTYRVTAAAPGYGTDTRVIELAEGGVEAGLELYLQPVVVVSEQVRPGTPIPDNNPAGISSDITVAQTGQVAGVAVDVDISHYSVGNLTVVLTSPAGTSVTLNEVSGNLADDLVGTWPTTLYVSGPGSLEDFLGDAAAGVWTLSVADNAFGATGTLNAWGMNMQVTPAGVAGTGVAPAPTRLLGNTPNPFNPRTDIAFELARPGAVRLGIYDIRGRLVRRLVDAEYPDGRHGVTWDGRDDGGAGVASGVYFTRLEAHGLREVRKMTLVR